MNLYTSNKNNINVAILYISTGRYTIFWDNFFISSERFLLPDCQKHYFLFTDSLEMLLGEQEGKVTRITQNKLGWPYDTLMRFDMFLNIKSTLLSYDYIYFFNGNTEFLKPITQEDLLPLKPHENLVVSHQPHITHLLPAEFPYERNPRSTAYIPYDQGQYYFAGGLNGGKASAFLEMCEILDQRIKQDLDKNIIALWHDESQLNKYVLNRNDLKILPRYFTRGEAEIWKECSKVMFSDKTHYRFGGHAYLRGESDQKISREEWEKKYHIPEDVLTTNLHIQDIFSTNSKWKHLVDACNQRPWKFFYRSLVPKSIRGFLKNKARIDEQKHVAICWEKFLRPYFYNTLEIFHLKPKQNLHNRKIIWQYWGQGFETQKLPDIVRLCLQSVEQYKGDYEIIRLNDKTVQDYIDFPDFVWEKRKSPEFKHAFFADLLRLALLDLYGGAWLDATILLTAPLPDGYLKDAGFFMFQRDHNAANKSDWKKLNADYFGWDHTHKVNVLNSFIMSESGNSVIHTCLDLLLNFWKTQNHIPHYFFFQIMFNELMRLYFADRQCPIIDDTLPHLLYTQLNQPFNPDTFAEIIQLSSVHKLSYLNECKPDSFYHHLLTEAGLTPRPIP
ncbi:family 6 glucosyltransferase [Eikenella corrodens]|uniref:family 6 glucosyltransferase n=1 Tax=Eikenella corrodens TaxID=539 RepID=UPI001956F601|nr:family 6 glucosyltransferase [Eikenella corrodens]